MVQCQTEIWKDVEKYEGLYQVSNLGRVKSLPRYTNCVHNSKRLVPEHIMTLRSVGGGYKQVTFAVNGIHENFCVHRLVAKAFIPNPNNLPIVNHKDENPSNNCVDNLEWCTYKYNSNYGSCKQKQSEHMKNRYKDPEQLAFFKQVWKNFNASRRRKVCQLNLDGTLVKVWESTYATECEGFYHTHVGGCASGQRKTHKGYKWVWYEDYMKGVD